MRLSYDDQVRAAYLRLYEDGDDVGHVTSKTFGPPDSLAADDHFVLDFDDEGRLVGIEFLTADRRLLPSILASAYHHGEPPR